MVRRDVLPPLVERLRSRRGSYESPTTRAGAGRRDGEADSRDSAGSYFIGGDACYSSEVYVIDWTNRA